MDLSIVIVSWKVREKLQANLSALFKSQGGFKFEVIVVDNNSQDGTIEMIEKNYPEVIIISNSDNYGFAYANNQAFLKAQGKFILLLNPDMQVETDTLAKTLAFARDNSQATVCGCKLIDQNGQNIKQVRRFPKLKDQLAIVLKLPHIFTKINRHYLFLDFDYSKAAKVDSIRGAFFLINTENYLKISKGQAVELDERYFVWFEEVDFCRSVYQMGGEVWYNPQACCLDYVGQSFGQLPRLKAQKYFRDSMLKYFRKWGKKYEVFILKIAWYLVLFLGQNNLLWKKK